MNIAKIMRSSGSSWGRVVVRFRVVQCFDVGVEREFGRSLDQLVQSSLITCLIRDSGNP